MSRHAVWPALLLLVVAGACVPSEDALEYDAESTMGEIKRKGTLVIGIEERFRPFGEATRNLGGPYSGFTVQLGRLVAGAIGVELEVVTESTGELLSMLETGEADLVFPAI